MIINIIAGVLLFRYILSFIEKMSAGFNHKLCFLFNRFVATQPKE